MMIVNQDGTTSHIDEEEFIRLSTTSPLSRFSDTALRLMYRWYEQTARPADGVEYNPYEMTRAWRQLDGRALVGDFGLPGQRGKNDEATLRSVLQRLKTETAAIRVSNDDYLIRIPHSGRYFN